MSVTILIVYVERGGCEVIGVVVVDVIGISVCVDVFSIEKNVVCVVSGFPFSPGFCCSEKIVYT